jgi:hypothetical protein
LIHSKAKQELEMPQNQVVSNEWQGQDGRTYRSVKFWVGAGYTAGFLQVQDDLLNWNYV